MDDALKDGFIIAGALLLLLLSAIVWTAFQWNVCMEEIGNTWYCIQHVL